MKILLEVMHKSYSRPPRMGSLDMFFCIAKLVDKYDCAAAIRLSCETWVRECMSPDVSIEDLVKLIVVSYLMKQPYSFRWSTRLLISERLWTVYQVYRQLLELKALPDQTGMRSLCKLELS